MRVVLGLDQRAKHEAAGAWLLEASEPTTLGRGVFAQRGRDPCIYTGWRSLHPRSYVCVVIIVARVERSSAFACRRSRRGRDA